MPVTTADEFGELSSAFNQMVDGLAERERLREAFGAYLDEEVARHIISEDYDPAGHEVDVSLVFCDVQDFTTHAANASASEVVSRLNELFECVVPIIGRHRGHVDQFVGDGLLAVWGAPERTDDHADRAVQCAVEIARTVNSRRPGGFEVGIGVNSGKVVAGSIGGAGRLSFSVIGDAVNLCLAGGGADPRHRRPRADHRRDPRAALRDDRGRGARARRDPRVRPARSPSTRR